MKKVDFLKGLFDLMRPAEWSKSLGNMVIAYIVASGFSGFDWLTFFLGFLAVGPFLWGGLYTLNDYTDWQKDAKHAVKKNRAIPSGRVPPKIALAFSLTLLALSFAIGFFVIKKPLFVLCLGAMLANQFMYTLKPFELKKKFLLDMISGSLVNPFFRFYSGWFLAASAFNAPIELVVFVLGIQFGGYSLYRLASKSHEEELNYKSTAVVAGEKKIRLASYAGTILSGLAFLAAIISGVLPFKYLFLAGVSVLPLPLYVSALSNPQKMNMKLVYTLIYTHYALFILGFVVLAYINV